MGLSSLSADSVPCTTFTPQEALVELLRIALAKDSVLVMTAPTDKPFLFTWLIKEWSWTVRQNVASILLVVHHERQAFLWRELLSRSTDLTPVQLYQHKQNNIFVTSLDTLAEFVRQDSGPPDWFRVSLCIVDNAHLLLCHPRGADVVKTLQGPSVRYKSSRFVALTSRVVCSAETRLSQIDANLDQLERFYSCPTEASCDLMSLLRFIANPAIKIIQHLPSRPFGDAEMEIRAVIQRLKSFLQNHVYSLLDIYGEEFQDLIEDIPDPTEAPLNIVNDFLLVMDTMGMWCAERAALIFLIQIEKLKMREKYERHYLLLSALYTEMVLIRKICCNAFGSMPDREKIHHFSSAKLLKLVDILRQYKPAHIQPSGCKRAPIKGESETQQPNNGHGRRSKHFYTSYEDPNALCGVIFVKNKFVAKLLYHFLKDLSRSEDAFSFLMPQYAVELPSSVSDDYDLELERRKQEDALRKFRMKESNLLVSNSLLEVGIDMVKCNLVVAFDAPDTFHAYAQYKVKAKGNSRHSHLLFFTEQSGTDQLVSKLSIYRVVEERLKARCILAGPDLYDVHQADLRDGEYSPFITKPSHAHNKYNHVASQGVTLKSAIFYLNRYCAKLPSDTFTRLTPLYYCTHVQSDYQCSLLLPINSPLKDLLMGPVMPSVELANRAAALEALKRLHEIHELDDYMSPVGKDGHRRDPELKKAEVDESKKAFPHQNHDIKDGRPGTTKRRQYYFKQVAKCLSSPPDGDQHFLYAIRLRLTCPVPDDQNTRGRPIFDPVTSKQNFGILCTERLPTICEFPIYTRSGELFVQLELLDDNARLSPQEKDLILGFHKYTFSTVLRLDKYPMKFSPTTAENKIIVLPLRSEDSAIDWDFLKNIAVHHHAKLEPVSEEARRSFTFDENSFEDAVVMPWYRNQDQPQYFYVAEVCHHLSPRSDFPGQGFDTFEKYYQSKYNISIQNLDQPLLDVDHTSARLNFLTPRYVNRKGVALPTSSEETKRAKRENLEQKQILIPELCSIHPFPATLWKHAVCLPCIIYRMNELLIADQLRALVAKEMGFVQVELQPGTQWPPLTFGWTLAEVLKNRNDELDGKKSAGPVNKAQDSGPAGRKASAADESLSCGLTLDGIEISDATNEDELGSLSNKLLYKLTQEESKLKLKSNLEIGTWSNDMADDSLLHAPEEPLREVSEEELDELEWMDPNKALPDNLTFIDKSSLPKNSKGGRDWGTGIAQKTFRVGSPTFFSNPNIHIPGLVDDMNGYSCSDSDEDDDEPELYSDDLSSSEIIGSGAVRIQFRGLNMAEAIEDEDDNIKRVENLALERAQEAEMLENAVWEWPDADDPSSATVQSFEADVSLFRQRLLSSESFIMKADEDFNRQQCSQSICLSMTPKRPVMRIGELNDLEDMLQHQGISPSVVSEASVDQEIATGQNYQLSFQFDHQPDLYNHPGPSPSLILQALTMSNSNDAINLERLETIGDSFLKYAITSYLFCMNPSVHEGRLSHLRSKQVSNLNLYRLGRQKGLGQCMVASKFDPHDNWLPPCYHIPQELEQALIMSGVPASKWNMADFPDITDMNWEQICSVVREKSGPSSQNVESLPSFVPYNLLTQHSIPDKSIADCVEALIGAYLTACGSQGALMFMTWLGLTVLPRPREGHTLLQTQLPRPRSPLLDTSPEATARLHHLLHGFDKFEQLIGYQFRDKSYLLQAFSHASYYINRFTDCYQRLEFLGDAVLDYLITRHLFEDPRQHSPGALTDLRSALVNNTIFASLAVKFQFHKYFKFFSPGLQAVVNRFVKIQAENNYAVADDFYFMEEDENDEAEDIEVPKALGDIFESVAGAIYLDSGLSLDSVWSVYYRMMKEEIDKYSENVPKSPIRELLELEPETAKFGKPEKLADGKRVRVSVEVFGKGVFKGIGRNYRIAKCTAAKCALRAIKKRTSTAH